MSKNLIYLLGAGASYNALPVVDGLRPRFEFFCGHFAEYINTFKPELGTDVINQQSILIQNLRSHYTVDTYAKKLFLKNPALHTNREYNLLINYLSAYFLYEQLKIDVNAPCNKFIKRILDDPYGNDETQSKLVDAVSKVNDYRYDSFFASVLERKGSDLLIPNNINFISWNYDFQFELSYINFADCSLATAMNYLNVFGTQQKISDRPLSSSHLIKLNGTAGFLSENKFSDLFDFKSHSLDNSAFEIFTEGLTSSRLKYQNAIRFAWEDKPLTKEAIGFAQNKISNADIIVVVGYSFPYFNRKVDREIFKSLKDRAKVKIYLQVPEKDMKSVLNRMKAVIPNHIIEEYAETDQFLIPNEMD